ncbi:MAG: hypothetical protein COU31_03905 [Candidatus Magasanikbacteria bacterium CG10_big_fil_rev_8_21_14_0_10_40_10]|uniref:Lipoprotein signal peptidase n=1 Tax=Candidatus Magasanikbacteria bacterium CG10_big_fil_rev_8_21_14_0_10_40_10 TaxID=1974648 RepID=A0A2M6W330_9BACT|nr:MAG: hypothetical protein COU31_03905 [Candidatus Magasanikbacteria bacterium CG10_big_fil_rev_8_21_14_0_10_40_10]
MNQNQKNRIAIVMLSGFFLFLDQLCKYLALRQWKNTYSLTNFLGWHPFANYGAAFGLVLPRSLIIILSCLILLTIFYLIFKQKNKFNIFSAWILVATGALSNLFDRAFRGFVVDYFYLITGYINLADILIVVGLLIFLQASRKRH